MPIATEQTNNSSFVSLSSFLTYAGLGQLFTVAPDGTPGGWLWDQIVAGIDSPAALAIAIESTPEYQTRFAVITELRTRAAAGEPVQIPTIAQVRQYEDSTARVMRAAGLPAWFYDSYADAQALMSKGLSVTEVEKRLGSAYERVQNSDPAIRDAFERFYGPGMGDGALAAMFLDPAHTQSSLEKASRAAYTAGVGRSRGIEIDKALAERYANLPTTEAGINQDLNDISRLSPLTNEGITEATDLTQGDSIEAVSFGDADAEAKFRKRALEREANDRSSSGGASLTQRGFVGVQST